MRILQINKYFYIKGGSERAMFNTAELLKRKGHTVAFFSMGHPDNIPSEWAKYFVSNVDYNKKLGLNEKVKVFVNTLYSKEAEQNLDRLIADFQPDIAHIHNFNHQLTPSILSSLRKKHVPVVITLHDYKLVCPSYSFLDHGKICELCKGGKFFYCLSRWCHKNSLSKSLLVTLESYLHHNILHSYRDVDCFISPSRFLINKFKDMGFRQDIQYLPNFIDTRNYLPDYHAKGQNIVFCGKLSSEKGIATLVKAVSQLPVTLNVCGDGPLMPVLKEYIRQEGIQNVNFLGHLESKNLFRVNQEALFSVVPSEWYENNPFAIIESFALGKPVVGARIGGIPELVKDGVTGVTFKPGEVEELRSKIVYMLEHKDEVVAMGKRARSLVEEEFNEEKHYDRLLEIYNKAIKEKGKKWRE